MEKKSKKFTYFVVIFLIIEALLVLVLDYQVSFKNPETGKFGFHLEKHEMTLQEQIQHHFQPDEYAAEHGLHLPWYFFGSHSLYDFSKKLFGKSALSTMNLMFMLIVLDLVLILIAWLVRRSLNSKKPTKTQILFESIYSFFEDLVIETLGKEKANFTPYIFTIFFFIWSANMIGMIPIPGFMEPTRNLNVPFGMGLMVVIVVHAVAIKEKGFWHHIQDFINPIKNPLFLLDTVGEVSKVASIAFRLFGNILGGAIIILVVSSLTKYFFVPVILNGFFGIFVGTIQAFVFTMLALTYIAVAISE